MKCKECGKKFYWYIVTMEHPKIIEAENADEAMEELQRRLNYKFDRVIRSDLRVKERWEEQGYKCEDCF